MNFISTFSTITALLYAPSLVAEVIALKPIPNRPNTQARWELSGDVAPNTIELAGITDHSVVSKGFTANGFAWFTNKKIIRGYHESFSFCTNKTYRLKKIAFPYNIFVDAEETKQNPEKHGIDVKLLVNGVNLGTCQWRVGNPNFAAWTWDATLVPASKNYCVEFVFNEQGKGISTFEVAFAARPENGVDAQGICLDAEMLPDPAPAQ